MLMPEGSEEHPWKGRVENKTSIGVGTGNDRWPRKCNISGNTKKSWSGQTFSRHGMRARDNLSLTFRGRGMPRGTLSYVTGRRSWDHIPVMCSVMEVTEARTHIPSLLMGPVLGRENSDSKWLLGGCEASLRSSYPLDASLSSTTNRTFLISNLLSRWSVVKDSLETCRNFF